MVFEDRFPSFEFELACLSPSIFVVFQKVGRRVEHHLSKGDRCSQGERFSPLSRLCAVIFFHRRSSATVVAEPRRLP